MSVEFLTSDSEHWYRSPTSDIYYPSATTILSVFPKGVGFNKFLTTQVSWESSQENLKAAGQQGTNVHKGSEILEMGGTLQRGTYTVREWQMLQGFVAWHQKHNPVLEHLEYGLVSDKLKTGGTIDRVYSIDGGRMVLDLKTSGAIYDNYWAQVAVYAELCEEKHQGEKINFVAILRVSDRKKSGYEYVIRTRKEWKQDLKIFKATQALWNYTNPGAQPKVLELPDSLSLRKENVEIH